MSTSGAIRAGQAYVELFADDSKLVQGLKAAEARLKDFGKAATEIGKKLALAGMAIAGPLVGAGKVFSDMGEQMAMMSKRTGVGVSALSELGYAASQNGTDLASLEVGLRKMQKTIVGAAEGSKEAATALEAVGLSVADLQGLKPEDQFARIATAIDAIHDPAQKAAATMAIFGKSGTELIPMMTGGAAAIATWRKEARELGISMSQEDAAAAEVFNGALTRMKMVLKEVAFNVGAVLAPVLTHAVTVITGAAVGASKWVQSHESMVRTALNVAAQAVAAGGALIAMGYAVQGAAKAVEVLKVVLTSGVDGLRMVAAALTWATSPAVLLSATVLAIGGYLVYASGAGGAALQWLAERFGELSATASASWTAIGNALANGDIGKAASVLWAVLNMEWVKGKNALESLWNDFTFGLLATMEIAWDGIVKGWINAVAQVKSTFATLNGWINKEAASLAGAIAKVLVKFANASQETDRANTQEQLKRTDLSPEERGKLERHWNDIKGPAADEKTQNDAIDRSVKQQQSAIDAQTAASLSGIDAQRTARLALEKAVHDQAMANLAKESQEKLDAAQAAVDAATADWKAAVAAVGTGTLPGGKPGSPDPFAGAIGGLDLAARPKVAFLTNANNIQSLQSGGTTDRIAKATEATAKSNKDILTQIKLGGLVFTA